MKTEIRNIEPNPHRRMDHYPIRRNKIDALKESFKKTGFWDNVVGRLKGKKVEIAYGHHRWIALQEFYEKNPRHEVDIIIRDFSEEQMLQAMADENMEEWGTSFIVEMETVQAVVAAYANDQIKLKRPPTDAKKSELRYAPSFIEGKASSDTELAYPYTVQAVAEFLGWLKGDKAQRKVWTAISALEFIEEGLAKEEDFRDLGSAQAEATVEQARRERDRREALAKIKEQEAAEAKKQAQAAERAEREAQSAEEKRQAQKDKWRAEERRKRAELDAIEQRQAAQKSVTGITRAVTDAFRDQKVTVRGARAFVDDLMPTKAEHLPGIEKYANAVMAALNKMLSPGDDTQADKLENLLRYIDDLDSVDCQYLIKTLEQLSERALNYAARFKTASDEQIKLRR